jgi:hypothetical protein
MTRALFAAALPLLLAFAGLPLAASAQDAPSRGRLLYDNHCVACHDAQVHWRDKGLVTDWDSLVEQVRTWQQRALLNWNDADVEEVSRFLNSAVYKLPAPRGRV